MPPKRSDFDPVLVDFRVRFAERVKGWMADQGSDFSQRKLSHLLELHYATVNGYLNHPETMAANFIERVSLKITGFELEWIAYRRLEEATSDSTNPEINAIRDGVARRAKIRETAAALQDVLAELLKLMDQLADEPSQRQAQPGGDRPVTGGKVHGSKKQAAD